MGKPGGGALFDRGCEVILKARRESHFLCVYTDCQSAGHKLAHVTGNLGFQVLKSYGRKVRCQILLNIHTEIAVVKLRHQSLALFPRTIPLCRSPSGLV